MDILLIGGAGSITEAVINKLNKEGHRIYVLTGNENKIGTYKNVFERYDFTYDNDCLKEIFESVNPDIILFMGAYDTNFDWTNARKESVRYSAGLLNILLAYSLLKRGRFIYLSSDEVYSQSSPHDIEETVSVNARSFQAMTILQGEDMCHNYGQSMELDIVILRLDHLYYIPNKKKEINNICARMCEEALRTGYLSANSKNSLSLLYLSDAVEFIYKMMICEKHQKLLYHISSGEVFNEMELAQMVQKNIGKNVTIRDNSVGDEYRIVLSGKVFQEEFQTQIFNPTEEVIKQMAVYMRRHSNRFLEQTDSGAGLMGKITHNVKGIFRAIIPFLENMICFIPFFMLNNRAVGSEYFANLDFYLLYVLLFAIVYGQQQATFSAILAVAGYCFRQMYNRSGFDVLLDYNTYVWIAQLFILGLIVGYMRDQLRIIKGEDKKEIDYLEEQLNDIQDINTSNVRMKNVLETQIVNHNDSFGKIYEITSSLDQYEPEEVLFYAAEVISKLIESEDVAIYSVANAAYARLFSATSKKARSLGNSIEYKELTGMYDDLKEKRVYINKGMEESYPLMANAIYSEDEMQMIVMIWGIPWERMNLSQANMLKVVSYLIQNAVIRANRYQKALENKRYIEGTNILEEEAFTTLVKAYIVARNKGLTECSILRLPKIRLQDQEVAGHKIAKLLRQSDYMGKLTDGNLYVLLSNTDSKGAEFVIERFKEAGYQSCLQEDSEL